MSIYFVPALLALIIKLTIFAYVLKGGRVSVLFLSLIVVFAAHNAIEIFGYFNVASQQAVDIFFRLYYVATIYVVVYMLLHGLAISKLESALTTTLLISVSTGLAGLALFTDSMIAGQYSIGYSLTAIKGPYYWLFAVYLLTVLIANVVVITYGYRSAQSQIDSVRCKHSMMALAPVMLVFAAATIFKIADVGINATGLVPIATSIFLVIVMATESKHKLSDLRRLMPLSAERETTNNLMDLLDNYIQNRNETNVYKDLQSGIEKEIIMYSLKRCDNNITYTAKMMGLKNRSTLYSMMNRLNIDLQELKQQTVEPAKKTLTKT